MICDGNVYITQFPTRNARVTFANRSRYGNGGINKTGESFMKKWLVVRMNDRGNVNAQVNAEKCTWNDRVQDRTHSRDFQRSSAGESVRKTDVDDDVATTVNFSHRKSRRPKIKAPRNMHTLQTARGEKTISAAGRAFHK